jgi:hypothetical protein
MEIIAELLFSLLGEILLPLIGQLLAEAGIESVRIPKRRRNRVDHRLAVPGVFTLGALAGAVSVWLVPDRVLPEPRLPGISLVVAPAATGAIMHAIGTYLRRRGKNTSFLATFTGAAFFALGFSVVRFLVLRRPF